MSRKTSEPKVTSAVLKRLGFSGERFFHLEELLGRPPMYAELTLLAAYRDRMSPFERVRRIQSSMTMEEAASQQPSSVVPIDVNGSATNITVRIGGCGVKVREAADEAASGAVMTLLTELTDAGAVPKAVSYGEVVGLQETLGIRALSEKLGLAMKECSIADTTATASHFFSDAELGSAGLFSTVVLGRTASLSESNRAIKQEGNPVYFLSKSRSRSRKADFTTARNLSYLSHQLMRRPYLVTLKSTSEDGIGLSAAQISAEHGVGITLDVARIPAAKPTSAVSTILLHRGRRGILAVVSRGFDSEVRGLSKEFKLDCHRVGETAKSQILTVKRSKKTIVSLPADAMVKSYQQSAEYGTRPAVVAVKSEMVDAAALRKTKSFRGALLSLLTSPNVAETAHRSEPKADSEDSFSPVIELSSSGRILTLDPRVGGRTVVASAARKLICHGINPATAVLNTFIPVNNSREEDELLREVFRGADEMARVLDVPIIDTKITVAAEISSPVAVAGVTGGTPTDFTPLKTEFKRCGDFVLMLGSHRGELGGSEYLRLVAKREGGPAPAVDLRVEPKLRDILLMAHSVDLIESARDVSSGGLAVALAQSVLVSSQGLGARIHMSSKITDQELLFGETQGVIIVTVHEDAIIEIERICMRTGVPCTAIGRVTDDGRFSFNDLIHVKVSELQKKHKQGLNVFRRVLP